MNINWQIPIISMVLLRKTYKPSRISKTWDKLKTWGTRLLVGGLFLGTPANMVTGCTEAKQEQQAEKTGVWLDPYNGEVLQDEEGHYYMAKRFIVKFKRPITQKEVEDLIQGFDGRVTGHLPRINAFQIETKGDLDSVIADIASLSLVDYAIRNYYFKADALTWDNDTYAGEHKDGLWWADKIELSSGLDLLETSRAELEQTTVALIDFGFNRTDEIPYADEKYHRDFVEKDNNVFITGEESVSHHGTSTSLFVAALNNEIGMNGVASRKDASNKTFRILPLRMDRNPFFPITADNAMVAAALEYVGEVADKLNIRVVNMSIGEWSLAIRIFGNTIEEEVNNLTQKNIIVVASAGNDGRDACGHYPAAFENIVSVGATDNEDSLASFSNYSGDQRCLTVTAPGEDVFVTKINGDPDVVSGTSFSAPMVSGLIALIKSIDPNLTYDEVVNLLRSQADTDLKRINVSKTLQKFLPRQEEPECRVLWEQDTESIQGSGLIFHFDKLTFFDQGTRRWRVYDLNAEDLSEFPVQDSSSLIYLEDKIVFVRWGKIFVLDRVSGETDTISEFDGEIQHISAYGIKVVFSTDVEDEEGVLVGTKLYLYNTRTKDLEEITREGENQHGPSSPDIFGDTIAFEYGQYSFLNDRSIVLQRLNGNPVVISPDGSFSSVFPFISGRYVVYGDFPTYDVGSILAYNITTSETVEVFEAPESNANNRLAGFSDSWIGAHFEYDVDLGRVVVAENFNLNRETPELRQTTAFITDIDGGAVIDLLGRIDGHISGVAIKGRQVALDYRVGGHREIRLCTF